MAVGCASYSAWRDFRDSNSDCFDEIPMKYLLDTYTDSDFLSFLQGLMPAVGIGVVLGAILVIVGMLIGFIVRAGSDSY